MQTIARTQAVEITFRNADPALAREIVNHLVTAYTQRTFMTRYNDTMKASDWLSGQLAQLKSEVRNRSLNSPSSKNRQESSAPMRTTTLCSPS